MWITHASTVCVFVWVVGKQWPWHSLFLQSENYHSAVHVGSVPKLTLNSTEIWERLWSISNTLKDLCSCIWNSLWLKGFRHDPRKWWQNKKVQGWETKTQYFPPSGKVTLDRRLLINAYPIYENFLQNNFLFKFERERDRERQRQTDKESSYSLVHSLNAHKSQGRARRKPGASNNSIQDGKDPSIWAITHCFPDSEWAGSWNQKMSWDLNPGIPWHGVRASQLLIQTLAPK